MEGLRRETPQPQSTSHSVLRHIPNHRMRAAMMQMMSVALSCLTLSHDVPLVLHAPTPSHGSIPTIHIASVLTVVSENP